MHEKELMQRQQAILLEIIQFYLAHNEPISARTLSKFSRLALSPTAIRNLMEDLSSEGLLTSEGVSRGRIPTQKAFTIYVSRLRPRKSRPSRMPAFHPDAVGERQGLERIADQVGRFLAQHSGHVALIALPPWDEYPLDWLRLAGVERNGILVAIRTIYGDLLSKVLETPVAIPEDVLRGVEEHIGKNYRGIPLASVRADILAGEGIHSLHRLSSPGSGFRLLRKAFEWGSAPRLLAWGQETLFRTPECSVPERLEVILEALHDPRFLETTLARGRQVGESVMSIGTDTNYPGLEQMSVVAFSFGLRHDWRGQVGVLGPMRMDYSLIYQLAAQCAEQLNLALRDLDPAAV